MRVRWSTLALTACLSACNLAPNEAGQISTRIGEAAHTPGNRAVDLPKLTSFGWDRLHLFPAGTSREDICKFLNAQRPTCARIVRYEAVPVGHVAMLFTLGYQLTHLELHADANGRMAFNTEPDGLPRSACVFRIRQVSTGTVTEQVELEPS